LYILRFLANSSHLERSAFTIGQPCVGKTLRKTAVRSQRKNRRVLSASSAPDLWFRREGGIFCVVSQTPAGEPIALSRWFLASCCWHVPSLVLTCSSRRAKIIPP